MQHQQSLFNIKFLIILYTDQKRRLDVVLKLSIQMIFFFLPAAHCLFSQGVRDRVENLIVLMGLSKPNMIDNSTNQIFGVNEYFIHPNSTGLWNDAANLAIIYLKRQVLPTTVISPICIWPATRIDDIISTIGYVAGWQQIGRGFYESNGMKLSRYHIRSQVNK